MHRVFLESVNGTEGGVCLGQMTQVTAVAPSHTSTEDQSRGPFPGTTTEIEDEGIIYGVKRDK